MRRPIDNWTGRFLIGPPETRLDWLVSRLKAHE
jgi:hypothetical protein